MKHELIYILMLLYVYFTVFDSSKPKAALTSRELAVELQELRKEMDSQNTDIRRLGNIQKNYEMITQMPSLQKDPNASTFLHSRPDVCSKNVPCILENGSRFFLRKRTNCLGNRGHENSEGDTGSSTSTSKNKSGKSENLLSKSMDELLKEADNLKIRNLTNKERIKIEELEKEFTGNENSELSVHEKGLWVDKYAPKMFAQLLSPEKTNREVLKALKGWDNYVFQSKAHTPHAAHTGHTAAHDTIHSKSSGKKESDHNLGSSPKSVKMKKGGFDGKDDAEETNVAHTDSREVRTHMIDQRCIGYISSGMLWLLDLCSLLLRAALFSPVYM
jgi:hypothetical protein